MLLHAWLLLVAVLPSVTAQVQTLVLVAPNDGEILTIGQPYAVKWAFSESSMNNICIAAVLRCPKSNVATINCVEATRVLSRIGNGSLLFTPDNSMDDGAFYRVQLMDTETHEVATSGTFTLSPVPAVINTE